MDYNKLPGELRLSLYASIGAFLLALFMGFIAQNPAGIVFMRAFISAFMFGALIYGGVYILKRYIPDVDRLLMDTKKDEPQREDKGQTGGAFDYTISDNGKTLNLGDEKFNSRGTSPIKEEQAYVEKAHQIISAQSPKEEFEMAEKFDKSERGEEFPSLDNLFKEEEKEELSQYEPPRKESIESTKIKGNYIDLGKIRIPNEPEAIARAIKRVMKQDEHR